MLYDYFIFPVFIPRLPNDCDLPPTIYAILNSYVNYGKDTQVKISNLAKEGRQAIFDFDYPLSQKVTKEDFETMILKHYMRRRIGFDTMTAFKMQLDVKLNEIMPLYNKLFDSLDGWDLFNDGEKTTHNLTDNGTNNNTTNGTIGNNTTNISDRRFSDTPQNELDNVKDGKYITEYNYDSDTNNVSGTNSSTSNTTNSNNVSESTTRSPQDKVALYKEFIQNKQNVYTMIFKDLDSLFYQLV